MNFGHNYAGMPLGGYAQDFGDDPAEQRQYQQHYRDAMPSNLEQVNNPYVAAGLPPHIPCDIKPRLTKEQHDILEAEYQKQSKPNTSTKKSFAVSLNVSLDKVNNWFQNRRAKSKQDAKKQQGAAQNFNQQRPSQQFNNNTMSGSESDASPAFSSPEFFNMMQQCTADDQINSNAGGPRFDQFQEQGQLPMGMSGSLESTDDQYHAFGFPQTSNDMFDSPQDLNRRTLTQEQFDAFQTGMQQGPEDFNYFGVDPDAFGRLLPDFDEDNTKTQDGFSFNPTIGAPMSSHDESLPSTISERSAMSFPSSNTMQAHTNNSSTGSDWTGSRSSSISTVSRDHNYGQPTQALQPQNSGPWRPGQSVPVDFNQLSQEFRQAAQGRQVPQMPQQYQQEQPLAWPNDEAYHQRADSQTNLITQSMSNVGIHTPQPQQNASFKSPTPSSSLAARRQRARPAALGLASLRSQSYSGAMQAASPGQFQPPNHHNVSPGPSQPLRRVKSSAVINGVTGGRIQKPNIGAAQRSPMNFSFSEAMNSPKVLRHVSSQSGNLVPPTPMSPGEQARAEQSRQQQQWQGMRGQTSRQASISESEPEPDYDFTSGPIQHQAFSSPPHTPLYPPQPQFAQQRIGNHVITENTPPQSAPASQQCFPNGAFMPPQPPPQAPQTMHQPQPAVSQPPPSQSAMQHIFPAQPQQMAAPERPVQMQNMSAPSNPHFMITSSGPMEAPMQFPPGGVPIIDANGQIQMAIPQQQYQFMHHPMSQPPPPPSVSAPPQQVNMQTPPQVQYPFAASKSSSPNLQVTAQPPKPAPQPAAEFFVHEYHPPEDVKRAATPRKPPVDAGPKNYTFANQTPEHFVKGKKGDKAASNSPASTATGSS